MGQDPGQSDESHRLLIDDELAQSQDFQPIQPQHYPPAVVVHTSSPGVAEQEEEEPRLCRICQSGEDDEDDETPEYDEESAVEGSQHILTSDATGHKPNSKMLRKNPLIKPCKCKGSAGEKSLRGPRQPMPVISVDTATTCIDQSFIGDIYILQEAQKSVEIYFACGIIITAIIGLFIFMYRCATEGTSSISMPFLCCPDGVYPFYLADCGAIGGGDAALAGLLVILILVVATVLMFGFIGAVSGVYTLVESRVEKVAGKVTERILDVD
ncbi:hypothetical protein NQZ79_g5274 [Umbelopsis isabellina]|nr:hypothetical protein NQZ79_g5274 [Umbelopsis isabellina]